MNDVTNKEPKRIVIYATGGAGINVARQLEVHRGVKENGFGVVEIAYIDTSRSNLDSPIKKEHTYLLDGIDGSGQVRSENHEEIARHTRSILQTFKPGDLNIILSSTSGGSGSVFSPLLAKELLAEGFCTVVIGIGSTATRKYAANTLATLKSYENVAKTTNRPVVMVYRQNANGNEREVDESIKVAIMELAILFSGQNHGLDTMDLSNWLDYERVTSFKPQLVSLGIGEDKSSLENCGNVISVATVANAGVSVDLPVVPDFQCNGIMPEGSEPAKTHQVALHFVIVDGVIPGVASGLEKFLSDLERQQKARITRGGILSANDNVTDSGLVL